MSKLVHVRRLSQGPGCYQYSSRSERILLDHLAPGQGWKNIIQVLGYHPKFDATVDDQDSILKLEIKFSSKEVVEIEVARYGGTPSGLRITTADFYCVVSPGWNSTHGQDTGKLRIVDVSRLKRVIDQKMRDPKELIKYAPRPGSPGAICVPVNFKQDLGASDGWVGDVAMTRSCRDGMIYDFGKPLEY